MRGTYANLVTSNRRNNSPKPSSVMKIWFNEFLQNAAFPAVVLAFACSPMNNVVLDAGHAGPLMTDRAAKMRIRYIAPVNMEAWYQSTKSPAFKPDRGT